MTPTPFDDHAAFERRWGQSASPRERRELADSDPLLFVADHIASYDRRVGCIGMCMTRRGGSPVIAVIPDAPRIPRDEDCLMLLSQPVDHLGDDLQGIGIVHHRLGGTDITDLDRRWAMALRAVSLAFDFEALGVMARLHSGELVHVDIPAVLPADYMSTIMG